MSATAILLYPDTRLRVVSRPIALHDRATVRIVQALVMQLRETMFDAKGWGLSAVQIGVPVTVCIIHVPNETKQPVVLVNPEVVAVSDEEVELNEGCLSFGAVREPIMRPMHCTVRSFTEYAVHNERTFDRWTGRAVLHEMEHLTGRLLIDHMAPASRRMIDRMLTRRAQKKFAANENPYLQKVPA